LVNGSTMNCPYSRYMKTVSVCVVLIWCVMNEWAPCGLGSIVE